MKEAKKGLGSTDPLFDNIITSIGDRVEKKEVGAVEKMTAEVHSLLLLVYKQNQVRACFFSLTLFCTGQKHQSTTASPCDQSDILRERSANIIVVRNPT
jgi:hypothetical protein